MCRIPDETLFQLQQIYEALEAKEDRRTAEKPSALLSPPAPSPRPKDDANSIQTPKKTPSKVRESKLSTANSDACLCHQMEHEMCAVFCAHAVSRLRVAERNYTVSLTCVYHSVLLLGGRGDPTLDVSGERNGCWVLHSRRRFCKETLVYLLPRNTGWFAAAFFSTYHGQGRERLLCLFQPTRLVA